MALYITISANDQHIKTFGCQNITPHLKDTATYRVFKYNQDGTIDPNDIGVVYHKISEGAVVLANKVLEHAIAEGAP